MSFWLCQGMTPNFANKFFDSTEDRIKLTYVLGEKRVGNLVCSGGKALQLRSLRTDNLG